MLPQTTITQWEEYRSYGGSILPVDFARICTNPDITRYSTSSPATRAELLRIPEAQIRNIAGYLCDHQDEFNVLGHEDLTTVSLPEIICEAEILAIFVHDHK